MTDPGHGGAILMDGDSQAVIENNNFFNNRADGGPDTNANGGAVYIANPFLSPELVYDNTFGDAKGGGNSADGLGGGLFVSGFDVTVSDSPSASTAGNQFFGNSAQQGGGGAWWSPPTCRRRAAQRPARSRSTTTRSRTTAPSRAADLA